MNDSSLYGPPPHAPTAPPTLVYLQGALCRPTVVAEGMGAGQQAHGGVAYNGISLSPDKQRLLVADMKVRYVGGGCGTRHE